jgi:hydroxymethylbilane synthase
MPPLPEKKIRIGTRGSPLALVQTRLTVERLAAFCPSLGPAESFEIIPIKTSGDRASKAQSDQRLKAYGGKGLFTMELEEALQRGQIDIAVHSVKDMPTWLDAALGLAAILPREDPRDALITATPMRFTDLPKGAVMGTSSPRRAAQLLALRPDLAIQPLRGNVETRLKKIESGQAAATLLAIAGLKRLGLEARISEILPPEIMLPSVGQGAIGLETRLADTALNEALAAASCAASFAAVAAERAMLDILKGDCDTPIGGLATEQNGVLTLEGLVVHPSGSGLWRVKASAPIKDAVRLGKEAGNQLRAKVPSGILPEQGLYS